MSNIRRQREIDQWILGALRKLAAVLYAMFDCIRRLDEFGQWLLVWANQPGGGDLEVVAEVVREETVEAAFEDALVELAAGEDGFDEYMPNVGPSLHKEPYGAHNAPKNFRERMREVNMEARYDQAIRVEGAELGAHQGKFYAGKHKPGRQVRPIGNRLICRLD
jgi:hypothetical protein